MYNLLRRLPILSTAIICTSNNENLENSEPSFAFQDRLLNAKTNSVSYVKQKMEEVGAPGMVVAVSVDGKTLWCEGFGYADVENRVPCSPSTVMRVASISKSFTALAVAKLLEDGKLDLDKTIRDYVPEFPDKTFDGKKVNITLRLLISHLAGIRHYQKVEELTEKTGKKVEDSNTSANSGKEKNNQQSEFSLPEYHSVKKYSTVVEALDMFKDDDLLHAPGDQYCYSTHAWTLISAAVEKASGREFLSLMQDHFRQIGMLSTVPDKPESLIYGRARYYVRNEMGRLENAPYVDLSYKWAGGGYLSTVTDLVMFGDAMMYSYQVTQNAITDEPSVKGILRPDTVRQMWSAIARPGRKRDSKMPENERYGMGWSVYPEPETFGCCRKWNFEVCHTGGAIGASSVLYMLPDDTKQMSSLELPPHCSIKGVSVAIITNMQGVGLTRLAQMIAYEFREICR